VTLAGTGNGSPSGEGKRFQERTIIHYPLSIINYSLLIINYSSPIAELKKTYYLSYLFI